MPDYISHRRMVHVESFSRTYCYRTDPNAGFTFKCDSKGNIETPLYPEGRENLAKIITGTLDVIDEGIVDYSYDYDEPPVIECGRCGSHVRLDSSWANSCDKCGTEYNGSGQMLAPRSQWGEDTGESIADMESNYDPEAIYQDLY